MSSIHDIGLDWTLDEVEGLTDEILHMSPVDFNEANRYLPESVTPIPGYMRFDVNPFMREPLDCFDVASLVREVNFKKGVQITYTTLLESVLLYMMFHVKTLPIMFVSADKELSKARVENNIIPMIQQSGYTHAIRTSDEGNTRKTGSTAKHIQFEGGGFLLPEGAKNADKMRMHSICIMLKDELDAWPDTVGKDGDPDALTDDRCSAYWERRKILRGGTPLIKGLSKVDTGYLRGDQRVYRILCKACGFPQNLRWETTHPETGLVGGFQWDMDDGVLILESVRYCCRECGEPHHEQDKERLFSPEHGAHWHPTARPAEPNIRSYHLPAMYSPIGMQPWYKCVSSYLKGWDPVENKVRDMGKYQVFYNNVLGESFAIIGARVTFEQVSPHRRTAYSYGQIPNEYAKEFSGGAIMFLTCQVDVHDDNLAVAVMGWAREARPYTIDYWRFTRGEGEVDCTDPTSPVWGRLREVIEESDYEADDGKKYGITIALIDAGYATDTVVSFCGSCERAVPILGRDRPGRAQSVMEFGEWTTKAGTVGYKITVDHYKDRIAPVLRREWQEFEGMQKQYHFNAPVDMTDAQLKELTAEVKRKTKDGRGRETFEWHRTRKYNELWDLLVYGHAAVEILAWSVCVQHFELEKVDWSQFWDFLENEKLYYSE